MVLRVKDPYREADKKAGAKRKKEEAKQARINKKQRKEFKKLLF